MRFDEIRWDSEEERALFLEEAFELLGTLEEGALKTPPPIEAMFRAAHTLKGSGGMLGLTEWVERAHRLEDAIDRRGRPDWQWTPELQQLVLETVDALRAELSGAPADDRTALVRFDLRWSASCPMPGVRALQAYNAVSAAIPGTMSDPPVDRLGDWHGEVSVLWVPSVADVEEQVQALLAVVDDLVEVKRVDRALEAPHLTESPTDESQRPDRRDATLRISADTLEAIMEGIGELLLDHGQLEHRLGHALDSATRSVFEHMRRRALDLQDLTLRARMLPLDTLFRQYPRAVHDIARKLNKKIELKTQGGDTELDRVVMDRLHEPLLHLLRNACDHGIESPEERIQLGKPETGTVRLTAYAAQGHVHIQLEDDGRGIDWQKLRDKAEREGWMSHDEAERAREEELQDLLFRPGVSTRDQVTDLSGRGVGLDVVRAFLDEIHGAISVESRWGQGTTFHIELPMTMAIVTALIVEAGPWTVGFPIATVERIESVSVAGVKSALGHDAVSDRNTPLPVFSLTELLDPDQPHEDHYVVRVKDGRTQAALTVGEVTGQQEIVIKPVEGLTGLTPWLSGVALLGDGRLALVVDVRRLVPVTRSEGEALREDDVILLGSNQMELLVFRLNGDQRYGINVYKTREVLPATTVTRVAGQHPWLDGVVYVRGQALPVINLYRALDLDPQADSAPLLMVAEFNQTVQAFGVYEVEQMVRVGWDAVETLPDLMEGHNRFVTGLINHPTLGTIQLLDFEALLAAVAPPAPEAEPQLPPLGPEVTVWLADDSAVARQQVEKALASLGVTMRTFRDGTELLAAVRGEGARPDVVVLDVEMPKLDGYSVARQLKESAETAAIPIILHTSLSGKWQASRAQEIDADAVITKFDPGLLAATVVRLVAARPLSAVS
ncbi:MAG: chemotaxis protein CheW [Firmicutes bacterium]|nr:chemotaxis protein CheW [Bacillota bacterium]